MTTLEAIVLSKIVCSETRFEDVDDLRFELGLDSTHSGVIFDTVRFLMQAGCITQVNEPERGTYYKVTPYGMTCKTTRTE